LTSVAPNRWFQRHPELVGWLESVLTEFYLDGEGPEWEAIWDQVCTVLKWTDDPPVDRCQALAKVAPEHHGLAPRMTESPRRFPPPWPAEPIPGSYVVRDANGQALAYLYSRDNPTEALQAKMLTKDEARRIAVNVARLPDLLKGGAQQG
jgi:hypothetical protein